MTTNFKKRRLVYVLRQIAADGITVLHEVKIKGHRSSFSSTPVGGGFMMTDAAISIWGLNENDMDRFAYLFFEDQVSNEGLYRDKFLIRVFAGDDTGDGTLIFDGNIVSAYADYSRAPEVPYVIEASSGFNLLMAPAANNAYKGEHSAASIIESLAESAGYTTVNLGFNDAVLRDQNLSGVLYEQIETVINAVGGSAQVFGTTIYFWSNSKQPDVSVVPTLDVSAEFGMVGFPTFSTSGLSVTVVTNPRVLVGSRVKVTSSTVKKANGVWDVFNYRHDLSDQIPSGPWFTRIDLLPKGAVTDD